jgi:hypothetical protein
MHHEPCLHPCVPPADGWGMAWKRHHFVVSGGADPVIGYYNNWEEVSSETRAGVTFESGMHGAAWACMGCLPCLPQRLRLRVGHGVQAAACHASYLML